MRVQTLWSLSAVAALAVAKQPQNYILPTLTDNPFAAITIDTLVGSGSFDRAFIPAGNITSYEWWYFDAVSSDGTAAVVFQPFANYATGNIDLLLQLVWHNGSQMSWNITADDKLYVSTRGDASSGAWANGGATWVGSPDLSQYRIKVDIPELDLKGEIDLISAASPHVAEGPAEYGARLDFKPELYWINPVPDAVAVVDFTVGAERLSFTGNGYHDQNWAPVPFAANINQWYWGHGRSGDYSVVWFYHLDAANELAASGYISKDHEILYSGVSSDGTVAVRPFGVGVDFPIVGFNRTANIDGYTINVNAGAAGNFAFTFEKDKRVVDGAYSRWIGTLTGGRLGEMNATGAALCEQMGPFA